MSSIHQALKKAQEEKDGRYQKYSGIVLTREKQRNVTLVRPIFWISLVCVTILLLVVSYSRIALQPHPTKARTPSPAKAPAAASQPAAKEDAKDLFEGGMAFHKSGRLEDAKRLYEKALRVDPGFVDALNNLGVISIHERDFKTAQRNFEKAIRLKPQYVDPYYNLGCLYTLKGELSQGIAHLKKAISMDTSVKDWAQRDTDFKNLWGVPEFQDLVGKSNAVE